MNIEFTQLAHDDTADVAVTIYARHSSVTISLAEDDVHAAARALLSG